MQAAQFCPLPPSFKDIDIQERLTLLLDWKDLQNEMITDLIDDMTSLYREHGINEDIDAEDMADMIKLYGPLVMTQKKDFNLN